ncbi:MAG TPA: TonB-dependent receptor [Bryobacteraceae bacterium]|nr:TonB-dependent receptor [Bryobacteraceae bacterium]
MTEKISSRRNRRAMVGMLALWVALAGATPAAAQTGTGNLQGVVKDLTGAVVPGANVVATHTPTNREFTTTTNEVGYYLFPSVQIGPYRIDVKAAGMEAWQGTLTLQVGQSAEVNPVLKVGATSTEVTVAGDVTPLITTNSPTLASVVERERIEQLPVNGRFVTTLVYMTTPGLESGSVPRVYGLRYASEMLQDGAILENREWQSTPARPPGLDTIAEFRAETNNSSAKMNRPGSVILTTRAGTNEFHGSVFETHRNSGFGVARARQDYYVKPPHLVRNEYGVSGGGPVFLPKLYDGRNRTFVFAAYEGYKLRQASTRSIAVPTAAMRQGDFSGLIDSIGRRITVYDPLTTDSTTWARQPFLNNQISPARQSPLSKYLNSITPLPTHPDNPLVGPNWFGIGTSETNQYTFTTRVDHRVTDNDQLFFRYSRNPSSARRPNDPWNGSGSPPTLDGKANMYVDEGDNDNGVANWTHTFSPTFFSETLFSVARDYRGQLPFTKSEVIANSLGLSNPFDGIGFPRITYTMSSTAGAGMSFDAAINPTLNYAWIYNVDQNFTKIYGRHEMMFGARFRHESLDTLNDQQEEQGVVNFNSLATSLYDPTTGSAYGATPLTGHVAANTYLGHALYSARFNRSWVNVRAGERSAYFQDNFKVNSRLTLNLGLRYEYITPMKERNNTLASFDMKNKAIVLARSLDDLAKMGNVLPAIANAYSALGVKYETPEQAGMPEALTYSNKWDFGPRAGFAYRVGSVDHPTVIRGGYAIYSFPESLRLFTGNGANSMPFLGTIQNNPNLAEQSGDGLPNGMLRSVPTIVAGVNSANALDVTKVTGITRGSGSMYFLDPEQPTARAHQWNLTVERELFQNTSLKIGYVGTHGARTSQWYSFNQGPNSYIWYTTQGVPLPTGEYASVATRNYDQQVYGTMQRYQKTGWSNSNNIQVEFEHRYSKGFAFQAFYVMGNNLRVAGDGWRDDTLLTPNLYLPGLVPTDDNARNRLLYYRRDSSIPKHRFNWNFLVDIPAGKGKLLGRGSGRLLDAIIGGWQVAGNGSLISRYWSLPTSNWGPMNPVEKYGEKFPIQDCRTGVCYDGWLYWNGYIPANRINSYDANGKPNGVMGVPESYKAFQGPLIPVPKDGGSATDPNRPYYETNTVWVPLKDGRLQQVGYNPGLHPLQNQFFLGPMLFNMDASAFKAVKLTERAFLRLNVDFFNVFNMPGTTMPDTSGVITTRTSANSPRVLQLTLRVSW